jgi:hypothetical protein
MGNRICPSSEKCKVHLCLVEIDWITEISRLRLRDVEKNQSISRAMSGKDSQNE